MVHASATHPRPSLDGSRIAANAGAILFNGALVMLLMVPLSAPQLLNVVMTSPTAIVPLDRKKIVVAPAPPKTEPVIVEFERKSSTAPVAIIQPAAAQTSSVQTMESVVPSLPTDTVAAGSGTQVASYIPPVTETGPLTGARLSYAFAPAPPYPADALREGRSGTVILEVLVGLDGKPVRVDIAQSSGQRDLDRIAVRHVLAKWRFEPAMRNGQPVQAIGRVPIAFSLD